VADQGGDPREANRPPVTLGVSLKLYFGIEESVQWAREVATIAREHAAIVSGAVQLFVMPSLPALAETRNALEETKVLIGAQDLHWEDRGAFTGAISGADVKSMGCTFVEIGHAERRSLFGETDDVVRRKLAAAVRNGLTPVLCVGEVLEGDVDFAVRQTLAQVESALEGIDDGERTAIVVAYEPVWAIGRPIAAPTEHISRVVASLRASLANDARVSSYSLLYGGSAQRGTLSALGEGVNGLFLGRFAHDTANVARILDEASDLRHDRRDDEFADSGRF
jgi:triosephosphate isomerase